jgi:hypothetical protein
MIRRSAVMSTRAWAMGAAALFATMSTCAKSPSSPSRAVVVHEPGVTGSADAAGCGDALWHHVHDPARLLIKNDCVTVTGVLMDSTASQSIHEPDGVRHEPDGDTHGWIKVDPLFANLLNAGNASDQEGNLVFEIVCRYRPPTQVNALSACVNFADTQQIPAVGTRVAITGTFVQDTNHARWNEIHPVSSIRVQ